jgi:hypothetical protein
VRGLPETFGELPSAALVEEIETPGAGQIRALVTFAGNPVLSIPNGKRLAAALPNLEFNVAIDLYVNETTQHADLILPPAWALAEEHVDLLLPLFSVRNAARWSPPVARPRAGERHDWEILSVSRSDSAAVPPESSRWTRCCAAPSGSASRGIPRAPSTCCCARCVRRSLPAVEPRVRSLKKLKRFRARARSRSARARAAARLPRRSQGAARRRAAATRLGRARRIVAPPPADTLVLIGAATCAPTTPGDNAVFRLGRGALSALRAPEGRGDAASATARWP